MRRALPLLLAPPFAAALPVAGVAGRNGSRLGAYPFPPLREQSTEASRWAEYRTFDILPRLMAETNVTAWVVIGAEYNEDPSYWALWPAYGLRNCGDENARLPADLSRACLNDQVNQRREVTLLTLNRRRRAVDRSVHSVSSAALRSAIQAAAAGPNSVVLNSAPGRWNGLSAGHYERLRQSLGDTFVADHVYDPQQHGGASHPLPMLFIEERDPAMRAPYLTMQTLIHDLVKEGFSERVITPGVTTTEDVNYWLKEQAEILYGLRSTSSPAVELQRAGREGHINGPDAVIQPGDLLNLDWALKGYAGNVLWTDTQLMGYVLRPGEREVPAELVAGLQKSKQLQDWLLQEMQEGRTGDEVARAIEARMVAAGWTPGFGRDGAVFSHPIGDYMHSTGPNVNAPPRGRGRRLRDCHGGELPQEYFGEPLRFRRNAWWSCELAAFSQWEGARAEFGAEEECEIDDSGHTGHIYPRQEEYYIVDWEHK